VQQRMPVSKSWSSPSPQALRPSPLTVPAHIRARCKRHWLPLVTPLLVDHLPIAGSHRSTAVVDHLGRTSPAPHWNPNPVSFSLFLLWQSLDLELGAHNKPLHWIGIIVSESSILRWSNSPCFIPYRIGIILLEAATSTSQPLPGQFRIEFWNSNCCFCPNLVKYIENNLHFHFLQTLYLWNPWKM
jgi:hypothetical protein